MTKIIRREDARVFHTDTGRTVTVTLADDTTPPWVEAEPHVETFFYATPDWANPTPLDEIESAFTAAYVNHRLTETPTQSAYLAKVSSSLGHSPRYDVIEDLRVGWEVLVSTRPGHTFMLSEFERFVSDVDHYLRGEVWHVNGTVVYATTADDAARAYLDTHP